MFIQKWLAKLNNRPEIGDNVGEAKRCRFRRRSPQNGFPRNQDQASCESPLAPTLLEEEAIMTVPQHEHQPGKWTRVILFVLFLLMLVLVMKGMTWCIGGVCDVGTDLILPGVH
ncbi:hypothetical protein [Sutterella parvirubra]|uniref:Uncharacterized protein n=1 Tax=Sutterella parvirubra YIT 11816 TaxID=762967 RepID=H3KG93_9BURK|nr:hypothetical protein [Sutterella parvirubra]EHY30866.1 hypothetical protein HMPREF9440_01772 [Sutterella parvirubra YIT 11816]